VALAAAAALGLGAGLGASTRAVLALREGAAASPDATARRFRNGLVVAQMSLAIVLLVSAGLLIRTLDRLTRVDPGFDPSGVVAAEVSLPSALYPGGERTNAFFREALARLRAQPAVEAAGIVSKVPMGGMAGATSFYALDRPAPPPGEAPVADIRSADEAYFRVMGVPLLRGRLLSDADGSAPLVVVSATLAGDIWPGQDPLGRTLRVSWGNEPSPMTVVGVVGDVRAVALDQDVRPMIYYSMDASPNSLMTLVARGRDPVALAGAIRTTVESLDRSVPVREVVPMTRWVRESLAERRSPAVLLGLFAGLALLLAAIGLYGVLAYAVHLQRKEIGIRMALGAGRGAVVWLVVRHGLALAGIGLGIGVSAALGMNRVLASMLVGTSPADPLVISATASLLLAVALLASWLPARRAARIAPIAVIRAD
jgi:predicted permease